MKKILLIFCLVYTLSSCNHSSWIESKQVEQIKVGMSASEVFEILGIDGENWDEWDGESYRYGRNFISPTGYKCTFWIYVTNGKVTNAYCI